MTGTNGCCATQHSDRLADRLTGVANALKSHAEAQAQADYETEPRKLNCLDAEMFRATPGAVLDLVHTGRSIEIVNGLSPEREPLAVLMPWTEYARLIGMRDQIARITGGFQPAR